MPLTRNQNRALECMLMTASIAEAARLAGLSDRTLHRYMRDPAFADALKQRRGELSQETAIGRLVLARRGLQALMGLLEDPDTAPAIVARVGIAAQDIAKQVELADLAEQLTAIEADIAEIRRAR